MPEATPQQVDNNATQGAPAEPERTFTQAELDAIVGDRLKRERAKYADYDELKTKATAYDEAAEASKTELQKAVERAERAEKTLSEMEARNRIASLRAEVAKAKGVDAELLRGETREEMESHADAIRAYAKGVSKFDSVPDFGETPAPTVTKESIEAIEDPVERVKTRAQHIDLYKS